VGRTLLSALEKNSAVIGTGVEKPSAQSVESVKIQPTDDETTYSIRCRTEDGSQNVLTVRFTPKGGGKLRLSHPNRVTWTRGPDIALGLDTVPVPGSALGPDTATGPDTARKAPGRHRTVVVPRPLFEIDCIKKDCTREPNQ
jgi:hypothetical protein